MITVTTYDGKRHSVHPRMRCIANVDVEQQPFVYAPEINHRLDKAFDGDHSPYWFRSSGDPTIPLSELMEGDLAYVDCRRMCCGESVWTLCRIGGNKN